MLGFWSSNGLFELFAGSTHKIRYFKMAASTCVSWILIVDCSTCMH